MAKICPLFSGSTGNSIYIGTRKGNILVDAGASMRSVSAALEVVGTSANGIDAVVITHEHTDHIKGLKTFLNKTNANLIASQETLNALIGLNIVPSQTKVTVIESGKSLSVGDVQIDRFATSHDCVGSSGYTFTVNEGKKISVCTDLGIVTDEVRQALLGSDAVLIESNHDVNMLKKGPYPAELKVRIMSDKGHISNNACAAELPNLIKNGTTRFILGHISLHNNTPILALSTAKAALADIGAVEGRDYLLTAAKPLGNGVTVI